MTHLLADILGWVGTATMVLGSIRIAHKKVSGLVYMFLGNVLFVVVGFLTGLWSLVAVSVLMATLDLYAVYHWRKK